MRLLLTLLLKLLDPSFYAEQIAVHSRPDHENNKENNKQGILCKEFKHALILRELEQ